MYITTIDEETEESIDIGSFNHAYTQARLPIVLDRLSQYTPVTELSLDVSGVDLSQYDMKTKEEVKPDLCLYRKRGLSRPRDILKMKEMPLLAVEIISPKQGLYEILEKFRLYFDLGIQSCWLVDPSINAVTVYSSIYKWSTFTIGDVEDETMGIRFPISEIFS